MAGLANSVIKHCPGVAASLLEAHLRRMPENYSERYSPLEIARHLRMLSNLCKEQPVEVEVRPLAGQNYYEVCVVGFDGTGVLAAITTALASDDCDVQDLQLSTYLPAEDGPDGGREPARFVDVARVACDRRGRSVADMATDLRDRLILAFKHLADGNLRAAQTAASDSRSVVVARSAGMKHPSSPWVVKEGMSLGEFRLENKLATGGMSEVYLATQTSLSRKVAVKVISGVTGESPEVRSRFEKEAMVLASFTCHQIVQVLASGTAPLANGSVLRWLAMEYLPNGDLATRIKRHGPPPPALGTHWFYQALQGLQYAHQRAIVHRDIKPHNLLLTADLDVKIADFGLLKEGGQLDAGLTGHGTVLGTPQYISPEQALGEEADGRSDIYSLGASFFHVFSGRLPFEEKSATALLLRITQQEPPALVDVAPSLPRPLAVILGRMLARRLEDRYQDVRVILDDLKSYLHRGLLSLPDREPPPSESIRADPPHDLTQMHVPTPSRDRSAIGG